MLALPDVDHRTGREGSERLLHRAGRTRRQPVRLQVTVRARRGFFQRGQSFGLLKEAALEADDVTIGLVLRDGLTLAGAGVLAGAPLALIAIRLTASMLVGITPWNPVALIAAAGVLVLAVAGATLVPARRAMRVEPAAALRT